MTRQSTPWMTVAWNEYGTKEVPGSKHNPRIIAYHAATHLKATTDEVAWCSSFANYCFAKAGVEPTRSAAARSWTKWGAPIDPPRYGCIVVFERSTPENPHAGHVGLYVGESDQFIASLGGNQANQVCVSLYAKARLLGYRWPKE